MSIALHKCGHRVLLRLLLPISTAPGHCTSAVFFITLYVFMYVCECMYVNVCVHSIREGRNDHNKQLRYSFISMHCMFVP